MNSESEAQSAQPSHRFSSRPRSIGRLKLAAAGMTAAGISIFAYFIYSVGLGQILEGVAKVGFGGFVVIQLIYLLRLVIRATAWRLSVFEPYVLRTRDTLSAVIIGEALSSMIPLGILVSGTAKAFAVRRRVPLVVGFSSIATENLFYSLVTAVFVCLGCFAFLRSFELSETWILTIDVLIAVTLLVIAFGIVVVIRQWHFASELCEILYRRGIGRRFLESGRLQVRLFENLFYGFYRKYPRRFVPILLCQVCFHSLGIFETWFILSRIRDVLPSINTAFLLESVSRVITIFFKLVPFLIGVDEAGAQFVTETLAIGAAVGVTLAIVRKGRILFWAAVGFTLIANRGFSVRDIFRAGHDALSGQEAESKGEATDGD